MIRYMSPGDIAARAGEVRSELDRLLGRSRLARRPNGAQWAFFRHCLDVLLSGVSEDFPCEPRKVLQYKFEVEDRLRRYYLARGEPVSFVFRLMHLARAVALKLADDTYPSANGYVLLVTEDTASAGELARADGVDTREYIERVVAEAADAEWAVYMKLPEINLEPLSRWILGDSAAYRRIQQLAERQNQRQWTLRMPLSNPSTKRLLDVKVLKVSGDEAWVRTKEYWYLRWWSLKKERYEIDYRETNTQKHILVRRGDLWLVEHNIYPPPRASTPHRQSVVVG